MSFTQTTFLGASISQFSASVGWNGQQSSLNISLVEDPRNGDSFLPVQPNADMTGKPYYFSFGNFNFGGILQRYLENNSVQGKPTYDVTLVSPTEVLDACQVIIDKLYLSTQERSDELKAMFPNMFNVFDYWERSFGFGGSQVNESGMPVGLILLGIINEQELHPMQYRGHTYYVDFTNITNLALPAFYRIGGDAVSLMELISTICDDYGADFIVNMNYVSGRNVISFKVVSRQAQPVMGKILEFVNSRTNVSVNTKGQEARAETTSVLISGGEVHQLYMVDTTGGVNDIWPYWGTDIDGNLIIGEGIGNDHTFNLNAAAVADILGQTFYNTNVLEMRCASATIETWSTYVSQNKPELAQLLDLVTDQDVDYIPDTIEKIQAGKWENDKKGNIEKANRIAQLNSEGLGDELISNLNRMYEFVKGAADEFYGKKFLVRVPDVSRKLVPETQEYIYDYNVADGGYISEGATPLGLQEWNQDLFQLEDSRFEAFVRFNLSDLTQWDLSELSPDDFVIQDEGTIFMKCQVDNTFFFSQGLFGSDTLVVITLPSVVQEKPQNATFGDVNALADVLTSVQNLDINEYINKLQNQNTVTRTTNFYIPPRRIGPELAAIPLKSNVQRYGPWGQTLENGKLRYEVDDTLVPWNYGGYAGMSQAIQAKVAAGITGMVVGETGSVEEPGTPAVSLGDELISGGPNVSDISVSFGTGGVTTQYTMRTFTPKFGAFARQNAERLRRLGISGLKQERAMKELARRNQYRNSVKTRALQGMYANMYTGVQPKRKSPHNVLIGYVEDDGEGSDTRFSITSSNESQHLKFAINLQKKEQYGMMGQEGFFRPYSTMYQTNDWIGHLERPTTSGNGIINAEQMNPFKDGHDITYALRLTTDGEYEGYQSQGKAYNEYDLRPIAIKGPMVMTGWGYDTYGFPVPNNSPDTPGQTFATDYLTKPQDWKTGPLCCYWSNTLKQWIPGLPLVKLKITTAITNVGDVGSGVILKYNKDVSGKIEEWNTGNKVAVTNFLRGASLTVNQRVYALRDPDSGFFLVISGEC